MTKTRREKTIEIADKLFYEQGFETTSVADICAPLGISKGNFHYHFKSKDDLLEAVILRRKSETQDLLRRWSDENSTPPERILAFIRILIMNQTKIIAFGCPVGTLCSELAKMEHKLEGHAAEIFIIFNDWLADEFRALGLKENADEMALHLIGRSQGIAVMANAFGDEVMLHREVEKLESWLKNQI